MPITAHAGADHIFPDLFAAPVAGDNMVQGQLLRFLPTILTGEVVAVEDLKASQLSLCPGAFDEAGEPDYRGHRKQVAGGVDESGAVFQHFRFTLID